MNPGLKESEGQRSNINVKFKRFSPRHKEKCPILLWNILCWNNGDNNTLLAFDGGIDFQKSHLISDVLFFLPGNCRKLLDSGNITEHGGDMFCNSCYRKNFGPKGYGFGGLHMDDGKNYTVSFYFPPCAFSTFFSVLNVIGGDFTIQSNHYYYCCNCSFWNAFRTLSSYLTQIYCIFNCGIE